MWDLLAPATATRVLADSRSHLAAGALAARLSLLHTSPQCDVLFTPAGATVAVDGVMAAGGGGVRVGGAGGAKGSGEAPKKAPDATAATPILPIDQVITSFYLRLQVADQTGVLSRITTILAEHDISIDAVLQRESADGEKQTDLIILTHDTVEGRMRAALAQMQALPTVLAPIVTIRKEELS